MSFVLNPTTLKMPWMPGMSIQNLWTGIDEDQNRFAYHATSQSFKTYVMTENFIGYQLKISNGLFQAVFNDINGAVYWTYGFE